MDRRFRARQADDIHAYVAGYEEARGRPFSKLARQSLFAHCVDFIAYGARCTHSLDPKKTEQDTWPYLLRTEGANLLRHATS